MDILFQDRKLEKASKDQSKLIREHGPRRATLIIRRLSELRAVNNLDTTRFLPHLRCHELKGNRSGTLAVDLDHPYRLIFEPAHNPIPRKSDGGLDWTAVTVIRVLAVEDYHD